MMSKNKITPSPLQEAVYAAGLEMVKNRVALKAERGGKNAAFLVRARAGTGKTTCIVQLVGRLMKADPSLRILYSVFNTRNATEAGEAFADAGLGMMKPDKYGNNKFTSSGSLDVKTMNSLGFVALKAGWGKQNLGVGKGDWWLKPLLDMEFPPVGREEGQMKMSDRKGIIKFIGGAMAYLAHSDEELAAVQSNGDLQIEYNTELYPNSIVFPRLRATLDRIVDPAFMDRNMRGTPQVSFAQQVYVPAREGMSTGNYDVVLVDEAQDQSPAKMRLLELALAKNGVMGVVGDPAQAIYGFAGADSDSIGNYVRKWAPKVLPLSVTYRCPTSVVEMVKNVVPDYECGAGTPEGRIEDVSVDAMHETWTGGDLCLSRTNAPLVSHCLAAWRQDKPACIVGKDFGESLKALIKDAQKDDANTIPGFCAWVCEWEERENERLLNMKRDTESEREKNSDIADTLIALTEGLRTVDEIVSRIERLFVEKADPNAIIFSSTHKYKGGEAYRVFMFIDTYKPTGKTYKVDEPVDAEDCIWYVAATRTKVSRTNPENTGRLFLVPVKDKTGKAREPKAAATGEAEPKATTPKAKPEVKEKTLEEILAGVAHLL